ncbi:hypothetical protein BCR36DRAFT_414395 [Piromyces finnis]|uniref:EGF-like domain-containing protein n=1 Tax=Piromyces finnis TaxID=1754191 RepID=A0A1Y1V4L8_9FUNG|nr:hypothetical protein BCR36DRAFT_414395 [Piromyces finnis]|eukprot:ORX45798.1 hypothetical protein BCR36DRAFT_414395 [Piromyces finnis]
MHLLRLYEASLFDEQSSLFIENTIFENISTFYKPIFQISYRDISFKNVEMNKINIYCDVNKCNLISVEMGIIKKNILFHDFKISDVHSNGNVFLFSGNDINIEFDNTEIRNSNSYGALLKCISENANIYFKNSKINNNKNFNKFDNGLVFIKNNINIFFIDSEFKNNESLTSGILYFEKIKNFNFTIQNSIFSGNQCNGNGGVINLIDSNEISDNYIKSIIIDHSIFNGNRANYFGGILYANISYSYNINIMHSNIINNYAGVAGGFLFFEQINDSIKEVSLFLKDKTLDNTFYNNTAISHGDIFATHPSKFVVSKNSNNYAETYSGGFIYLTLELQDDLNNKVNDSEKYYSDLGVQAELYEVQNTKVENYIISDIDSLNRINSLKIYTENPGDYYIHFISKNNSYNILKTTFLNYKIKINDCDSMNYKLRLSNNLFYCESPICDKTCVSENYYECIKGNDTDNINTPVNNICKCIKGRKGKNCLESDFADIRKFRVIKDFGILPLVSITIGCICGIYSNIFITSDKKQNCYVHLILAFIGFILIYIPFSMKLIISSNIMIKFNNSYSDNVLINAIFSSYILEKMFKVKSLNDNDNDTMGIGNINEYINKAYICTTRFDDYQIETSTLSNSYTNNAIQNIQKIVSFRDVKSIITSGRNITMKRVYYNIYLRVLVTWILLFVFLIFCMTYSIIVKNNDLIDVLLLDQMHFYKCPYEDYQKIIALVESFLLIFIIIKYLSVKNGRYIYMEIKIIIYNLFYKNIMIAQELQFFCNSLCYFFILSGYYLMIFCIIFKKQGNNRTFYFLSIPKQKCTLHNSYSCECDTGKVFKYKDEEIQSINEYIKFYKRIFKIQNIRENFHIPKNN